MRHAARLAQVANTFRSSIRLFAHGNAADARSVLSVLLLAAVVGTVLDVEVSGEDEGIAVSAVEELFETPDAGPGD